MSVERWRQKADALKQAWNAKFGRDPSANETALALSVAQHETACGDAWPNEFNWGAVTLRALNAGEIAAVGNAGVHPTVGPGRGMAAAAAETAIAQAGLISPLGPPVTGRIHCDSYPGRGAYFVWFAAFDDDVAGAAYFLKALCRTTEERLALDSDEPYALAIAMYHAGYYSGFHTHSTPEGNQANIDDYASALRAILPGIRAALDSSVPTPPHTLRYGDQGEDVRDMQKALNKQAQAGLIEDGIFGPHTEAAVIAFQRAHNLKIDGVVGPETRAALGLA